MPGFAKRHAPAGLATVVALLLAARVVRGIDALAREHLRVRGPGAATIP